MLEGLFEKAGAGSARPLITALRLFVLIAAIVLTARLGWQAATPPPVVAATAPATRFSAARAMIDLRAIAMRPHPTGSVENVRVATYLVARLAGLGLEVQQRHYLIDAAGLDRLRTWSGGVDRASELTDLIGILPGRDRTAPAVVLMAHYDTVWGSPGAGDDSAGVAAALEIVRAVRARGVPARDLIVLLTDGEEIGLAGARAFWSGDALADRAGVVVNLEARGLGGRATMFETGAGNGAMIALFGRAVAAPVANALAVTAYRHMPNNTDFTPARERGLPGFNIAFLGRAAYYHSPQATIDRLDPRAVQDMGAQGLDLVSALAAAPSLPARAEDASFFDVLGGWFVHYRAGAGWLVILGAAGALVLAGARLFRARAMSVRSLAAGVAASLWLVAHAALGLIALGLISVSAVAPGYYSRLAALPLIETAAALTSFAALGGFLLLRAPVRRWLGALPALVLAILALKLGGPHGAVLALGVAGAVLGLAMPGAGVSFWGGWIGAILPVLIAAIVMQSRLPTAAWLFAWPALVLALAAALAAWIDPRGDRGPGLVIAGVGAVIVSAPLLPIGHLAFLGIGGTRPTILLLLVPTLAAAFWPIARTGARRPTLIAIGCALIAAGAIAVDIRTAPRADSIPAYSDTK